MISLLIATVLAAAKPTGPYRWLLVESTAEFMSIKALGALQGHAAVAEKLAPMIAKFDKRARTP